MASVRNYRDLKVWQESMKLAELIYSLTKAFPNEELYGLTSQLRRSAISIPSNLAEGYARRSGRELIRFLLIARGSLAEMETQILLTQRLGYVPRESLIAVWRQSQHVGRLLHGLLRSVNGKPAANA